MNMIGSAARGRARGRGRQLKVVALQNNVMGPPTRPVLKRRGSSASAISSRINWKVGQASNTRTGTFSVTNSTIDMDSTVILALTEGRGEAAGEVGIAAISILHPALILCQLSDSQSYMNTLTKINILNPTEILIPLTFANSFATNRLVDKLKEQFRDIKITGVTRSTFNSNAGMEYLKRLCVPSMTSIFLVLQHKYYALSAAAALLTYTESTLYVFYAKESIKIDYQESEGSTIIDVATADRLELVASARPTIRKRYSCLLDVLNYCCTKIGVRTLRANILQPPCSVTEIEARLNCVTELMEHSDRLFAVQEILTKISNIDQLLILPTILPDHAESCSERQLNYLLTLNTVLEKIEPLYCIFENSQQPFFVELYNILSDREFVTIKNLVRTMIYQNSYWAKGEQGAIQRCFAIKSGLNSVLDLMRTSYSERREDMRKYIKSLSDKYGLALTLHYTNKKGYHIILNLNVYQKRTFKRCDIPEEFIQVEQYTNSFTMKTQLLINLSHRLEDIMLEILTMSNIMIHKLLIKTHQRMAIFYRLCEAIAKLDMLQSLAQASNTMHYTRPKFGDYLELQESYHPLLYYLCSNPVPNSIHASSDYNMNIITGPNGSGKSIYIRQVVLLQVMAQVGCYVPAHSATFKLCDRILARVYLEDNIHYGASAFVLEMTEIKYFLTVLTNKTLIIIDEMCRSTSVEEGTALAMAICERLLKTDAFVFFTTHYKRLANLSDLYYNIKTWQLETCSEMKNDNMLLNFTYNTIPGVVSLEHYGIFLAKATWPESIMKYVYDVIAVLMKSQKNTTIQHQKINEAARLKYHLEAEFKLLKSKKQLTRSVINEKLLNFQTSLQGIGHNSQICVDNKADDSSMQEDSSVDASAFVQIEVLAEVHNDPKDSTISAASQYTLRPPFSNPDNMLHIFDETATSNNKEAIDRPELSFDNIQLSQIPSQSMMNLTPNENGQVNISRAISQKISPKYNLEYSSQYFNTYNSPFMVTNETKNYLKSPTGTPLFYNSGYSSGTNLKNSELDRTSETAGTIYKISQDCSLQDFVSSSMNNSTKAIDFYASIASLDENEFFMGLEGNCERASTPIPTESQNLVEQQKSNSSRPQTNSNSIKWTEEKKDNDERKISVVSSSLSDLNAILNDAESCSEYFSETEWDHIDKDVYLQIQNQSRLEQKSKGMQSELEIFGADDEFQEIEKKFALLVEEVESNLGGTTSLDDQSYESKIKSNYNTGSLKSNIHFSKDESLKKNQNIDNKINGKSSYYGHLETCQESSSESHFSRSIPRESTNSVSTSNCDENNTNAFEENFLKQISLTNKVTSNSTKNYSDDIKWASPNKHLTSNSNQATSVTSEENVISIPSNSNCYSGWNNPRRRELNKNDPRLKTHNRYLLETDNNEPERNSFNDPQYQVTEILVPPNSIQFPSSHSNDIGHPAIKVLFSSNSGKSEERNHLRGSERGFDQRNTSSGDKNMRKKPEQHFLKDVVYETPKIEFLSNCSKSLKSSSKVHHRSTSSTLTSKVSEIHTPSYQPINSNRQSELGNLNISGYDMNVFSTSDNKTDRNGSEMNDLELSSNYGNYSEWSNLERSKTSILYESAMNEVYRPSNSTINSSNVSDVSNFQTEFSKWSYTSKKKVQHGSTINSHSTLSRDQRGNNELEERANNDDLGSDGIINDEGLEAKFSMDSGHKKNNDTNALTHFDQYNNGRSKQNFLQEITYQTDKINVNNDELNNVLKDNADHVFEENLLNGGQIRKINILSNVLIKPGGNFCKSVLNGADNVCHDKDCNIEAESQIINENVLESNSTKNSIMEPGVFLKNDDHDEKSNSKGKFPKNIGQQASEIQIPLVSGSHSKWDDSVRSNSVKSESKHDKHVSFTNMATSNCDQNTNGLEASYDPGNSPKMDKNVEKAISSEIIRQGNKSRSMASHSVEAQNQVSESPILKMSRNAKQKDSQSKIDKARESFNQTLESLGDIHLELFSNDDDTSDSSEENECDSDYADENEKPVENQTSRKRKRLGCTRGTTSKQFEKEQSKKPKFAPPFKAENSRQKSSTSTVSSLTMSKREIEQMYLEKNRQVLESNNVSIYVKEIMNRPSIRQLRQAEHIVTAYKTNEGVLVVPAQKKNSRKKKFVAPLKESCGNFDVTIFSDKNSNKYREIMNMSKNKDSIAGSAPFEIISSEVVSRRSVFDKSNESFSFSDTSFFKSLNTNVRYDKPDEEIQHFNNSQHQKRIDSLLHKYLDTKSTDQSNKESVIEISSSPTNFNSSFFSHSTTSIFNFD